MNGLTRPVLGSTVTIRDVLLPSPGGAASALVRVGAEERPALEVALERQPDRRAVSLEARATGGRFPHGPTDPIAVREKVRRSGVNGFEALNLPPKGAS
jgi:hypothetical protein